MTAPHTISFLLPQTSPELSVLLALLHPGPRERRQELQHARFDSVDWTEFLRLAVERHRVVPHVSRALEGELKDSLPPAVVADIRSQHARNVRQCLVLCGELARLAGELNRSKIPFLCLKGPALSVQLHDDPAARHYRDLDLVAPIEHLQATEDILTANGFRPRTVSVAQIRRHLRQTSAVDLGYYKSATDAHVELHWCPLKPQGLLGLDFVQLHASSVGIELGGQDVRTTNRLHTLQLLCAHGAKHAWFRLKWLCDLAALVFPADAVDWDEAIGLARRIGTDRMVRQGVALCERLLELPSPLRAAEVGDQSRTTVLVRFAESALVGRDEPWYRRFRDRVRRTRYQANLRRNMGYRWMAFSQLLRLRLEDLSTVRLPPWLFPLHYVLRPFFILRRYVTRRSREDTWA
jgi:hypothetical protein